MGNGEQSNGDGLGTAVPALAVRRPRDPDLIRGGGQGSSESGRPAINVLAVAWRRRWIVIACVSASLIAGAFYLARAVPIYSSTSVLLVQQSVPKIFSDALSSGQNSTGYLATQCMLIQSTAILKPAAALPQMVGVRMFRGAENPVGLLKAGISATVSKQGDLINVSMESTDPRDAAVVVNAVVEAYIEYQSNTHQSLALQAVRTFQKQMDEHEAELKTTQDAMLKLLRDVPELAFQTEKGTNVSVARLQELTTDLAQAQARAEDLDAALKNYSTSPDAGRLRRLLDLAGLTNAVAAGPDPRLVAAYDQADRYLQTAKDTLGVGHPTTLRLQRDYDRSVDALSRSNQANVQAATDLFGQVLQDSKTRVTQLQKQRDDEQRASLKVSEKAAEYATLRQQSDRTAKVIDTLDAQIKSVNVNEEVGTLTVSVLESAKPGGSPVRPQRSQAMGMALVVGLMAGLGGALLRDLSDHRLRSAEEIASVLDLPILGAVPHMLGKHLPHERGQETHHRPRSDVAEAYRTIRTAIYFGLAEQQVARTMLVTSPSPGDGKSTSAANLAIAMAQSGRRVLLIDADCRRPVQHRLFKLHDGPGLSNVLVGQTKMADAVQHTAVDRLDVLPCGPLPPNPAELLDSQAFLNLLGEAAAAYDQVLLDSPPVVPVTDARIISASCDATVLVLRAEKSTRRLAEYAREGLGSVGANLLGVIVNDVPRGKDGYGYYYYGYGGYGSYGSKTHDLPTPGELNGHAKPANPAALVEGPATGGRVSDD